MALNMVKPFLRQTTLDKIVCLGSKEQYEPVLTQAIPRVVLPKFWGGTRVDEDGDPKCSFLVRPPSSLKSLYVVKREVALSDFKIGMNLGKLHLIEVYVEIWPK